MHFEPKSGSVNIAAVFFVLICGISTTAFAVLPALAGIIDSNEAKESQAPLTQTNVRADPAKHAVYRASHVVGFYLRPVPDGIWENKVTLRWRGCNSLTPLWNASRRC
jgi:hypothetical protein